MCLLSLTKPPNGGAFHIFFLPLSQVRALALLQVADAVRRAPSATRPGGTSAPPSDTPVCCRLFSWNALFPPAADGSILPSGDELTRFAAALKSIAQDAAKGASSAGSASLAPSGLARGAPPPSRDDDAARLSRRSLEAACRTLTRGADAAIELLRMPSSGATAPQDEAALVVKLRAARAAVLLENLAGSIHGKHLRAFLLERAAMTKADGASAPAPPAAGGATDSVAAATAALVAAWSSEEASQALQASVKPALWPGVSVGGNYLATAFCVGVV